MNKLKEQIKQEVVLPVIRQLQNTVEGHVTELYPDHMMADVNISNPFGHGILKLEKVPIQIGAGGFSQSGPFRGDKVVIAFKNFNPHTPVITALLDTNYSSTTKDQRFKHSRKGAYIPDGMCNRNGWDYSNNLW